MKEIKGVDVKIWLLKQGLQQKHFAKAHGCSDMFVSYFIRGERRSKQLEALFINRGCPKEYFKDGRVVV